MELATLAHPNNAQLDSINVVLLSIASLAMEPLGST